jgi:hypothetical protein
MEKPALPKFIFLYKHPGFTDREFELKNGGWENPVVGPVPSGCSWNEKKVG